MASPFAVPAAEGLAGHDQNKFALLTDQLLNSLDWCKERLPFELLAGLEY